MNEIDSIGQIMQGIKEEELATRLGVEISTLTELKSQPDFAQWSKQRDPESVAWQYQEKGECYLPQLNFST